MKKVKTSKYAVLRRVSMLLVLIAVAGLGYNLLSAGSALSETLSYEAEQGSVKSPAAVISDTAAANGGALKFSMAAIDNPAVCPIGMGHRGFWSGTGFTEDGYNSELAAYNAHINWAETDIHFTSDGVPVLMHDDTVDRTTNGTGLISSKTLAQFQALRLNDGEVPPTLARVIELVRGNPDRKLMVEVKDSLTSAQRQTLLTSLAGLENQIYLNGFSPIVPTLQALKTADPQLHITELSASATTSVPSGLSGIDFASSVITASLVGSLHTKGFTVRAYTPDTLTEWRNLKSAKVDGIITNQAGEYAKWIAGGCK